MKDFIWFLFFLFMFLMNVIGACFWGGYLFTDFPREFKGVFVYKTISLFSETGTDVIGSVVMIALILLCIISFLGAVINDKIEENKDKE